MMSARVLLEFYEEDKDFLDYDSQLGVHGDDSASRSAPRDEGDFGASVLTPSTRDVPLDNEADDLWHGWNAEDKLIADEVAQFGDDVGFLDEEQTSEIHTERTKRSRRWGI